MIHTSYFASRKWELKDAISIAILAPKGFTGGNYPTLYPTVPLLKAYKAGKINDTQYAAIYIRDVLRKLDPAKVAKDLEGKTLLCYEKSGSFCHRNLVANWLRKNGYQVKELS